MSAPSRKLLVVCLGNICRSPTAEGVLRHLLAEESTDLRIEVDSAGTGDYHLGEPPDLRSQRAAKRRGIDLSGLSARQVRRQDFDEFDLILAMDRRNLADLEAMRPAGSRAEVRLFLEYAGEPGISEVPDPYFGDAGDFDRVLDLVTAASRRLIERLRK
ncbi:MAG: low molecular weight protein-tyrosine-phosphatase [Steroidobacteraceae bacterium]|jgi:protein-tyrosine phosphatase